MQWEIPCVCRPCFTLILWKKVEISIHRQITQENIFLCLGPCWQDTPGKTGAGMGTWEWKGCKGSVTPGRSPTGDMRGGSSLASLKISDPLCSVSPSFKIQRVSGSWLLCVVTERSHVTMLCMRYGLTFRACRMGLNHMSFTNTACNWAYLLHLVSLILPIPHLSYLFFPGCSRLQKERTDAAHGVFNSGHCGQPLVATLGINNRKAQQLITCQNPFPGLWFCSCKPSQPAGVWFPEEMLGKNTVRRDVQMGQGQCWGSEIWGYGALSATSPLPTS